MSARDATFDLAAALGRKGFTPGQRDVPSLVAIIVGGAEPATTRATPLLAALGASAREVLVARTAAADLDDGARARLITVLGLVARTGDLIARDALVALLGDAATRVRRAAAVALGKLGDDEVARTALLARWDQGDAPADERRALAEALGKLGGEAARTRLTALDTGTDPELARRRDRALLMVERTARRDEDSTIATAVPPPLPVTLRLGTRAGLAPLLLDELALLGMPGGRAVTDGVVQLTWARPLAALMPARLWASVAIRIPLVDRDGDLATTIIATLTAPATRALLRALTLGALRWRLGFAHGHKRAIVWRVARDVTAAAPELVNDPTATTWDVLVDDAARTLDLVPRRLVDTRFDWRVAEVPASSHPTVAAALARVAGVRAGDRVWDPFCGAGAELVERVRLGPVGSLLGTDVDASALAAARANLDAAGITASLVEADARGHVPGLVDLVITNPPLGSRVQVDAAALLVEAIPNLVRALAPGGRLVWISPSPRRTSPVLVDAGLTLAQWMYVDLGGVRGRLERWVRP